MGRYGIVSNNFTCYISANFYVAIGNILSSIKKHIKICFPNVRTRSALTCMPSIYYITLGLYA